MKTNRIFLIVAFFSFISHSQSIANFSIDSGGLSITNSNIRIFYTIGEVNVQENVVENISLSEGFVNSNIVSETLGVDNNNFLEDEIIIFPNPASEIINISSMFTIEKVQLFDSMGKEIIGAKESTQLKIEHLSSGLYMLKVFTQYGSLTKKIIIY